jgi:hypothetical protein
MEKNLIEVLTLMRLLLMVLPFKLLSYPELDQSKLTVFF